MKNKVLTILVMILLCVVLVSLTGCSNNDEQVQRDSAFQNNVDENEYVVGRFETLKVEKEKYNSEYTVVASEQSEIITKEFFTIDLNVDKFEINIIESDRNKQLIEQGDKIKCNESYTIKNVGLDDIIKVFYGNEGQDLMYPAVFLLLSDGTVKGIDAENGYKTGEFIAYNIPELKDIITIEQADVHSVDDSGYEAVIAITKDEEIYEIRRKS